MLRRQRVDRDEDGDEGDSTAGRERTTFRDESRSDASEAASEGLLTSFDDSLVLPTLDPLFYIDPKVQRQMEAIYTMSKRHPVKVLMVGPQGCGKTEMARWLAATHRMPWLKVNCPAVQDPRDWFGWMTVRDGATVYQPTALAQAIERGHCIVFFDELNRLHTSLWGPLYGLLDDTNQVWVDQLGRHLRLSAGTIVIAAMNEGSQNIGVYLARCRIDGAICAH